MNLPLFVSQLAQVLQNANATSHLVEVCELLRSHISAAVTLTDQKGQAIIELLQLNSSENCEKNIENQPIIIGNFVIGYLNICRVGDPFTQDEKLGIGVAFSIVTLLLRNKKSQDVAESQRRREVVRNLINTLSFSELEATAEIMSELGDKYEGLLIAGSIADRLGFTRSVITSALKKLDGAGLVETRSLGMKGTYIRVKEMLLVEEMKKLQGRR